MNESLRAALRGSAQSAALQPFTIQAQPLGLLPGLDPRALGKLADDLEAEAFAASSKHLGTPRA